MWSGIAVALYFLAFRIFVRIKSFRRIYVDNVLVLIAWLMFLAFAIIWQSQQTALYEEYSLALWTIIRTPDKLQAGRTLLYAKSTNGILYLTSLWIIKFSFPVFFRRIGQNARG